MGSTLFVVLAVVLALIFIPLIISRFLTQVEAGTIRLVSSLNGRTAIYKGPGKAIEIPLKGLVRGSSRTWDWSLIR